jgi:basic membrane protein A and related proteins
MKKSLIVVMLLALALGACAPKAAAPAAAPAAAAEAPKKVFKAAMVTDLGGLSTSPDTKGFSDLCWEALEKGKKDLGIEITLIESKELADLEPNLTKAASEGYNFVVGCGFLFTDAMKAVAPKFPKVNFALVDSVVDAPNVQNLLFAANEGGFLVGAMAAGMSKTGKVGFLGGMEGPLIKNFEVGYLAGAKTYNPAIQTASIYTGSFSDVAKGKEASLTMFKQGADVIYAAAGACGLGTIEAAKENGFWAIGVDTDQDGYAKGSVLTSMVKRVEVGVYNSLKSSFDGTFKGGIVTSDLKAGGVGISEMKFTKDKVPAELLAKVMKLADMIKAGTIKVPGTQEELDKFVPPTM